MENPPDTLHTVLLVDDSADVREALRWALEAALDLTVVGAVGTGEEAMEQAAALHPEVVILDIELPDHSGYEVCRSLKKTLPAPAVLFLTIHTDLEARRRSREAGSDGFVEKGAGWPLLLAQVRDLLAGSKLTAM